MLEFDRRSIIALGASFAALRADPLFAQEFDEETNSEISDSMLEEIEAFKALDFASLSGLNLSTTANGPATKSILSNGYTYALPQVDESLRLLSRAAYWSISPEERMKPEWLHNARNPDLAHVADFMSANVLKNSFKLTAEVLAFLASRNAFVFGTDKMVVFALRGCALLSGSASTNWAASHELVIATPDHEELRCIIGLWRRSDGMLRLYRASTVPEASNMFRSLKMKGGTSLLPAGLYNYSVGTHKANKPTRQPGALRNTSLYVVLRTTKDLKYDPADPLEAWTLGTVHNIHAAGRGLRHPRFDSAGCQVIPGFYDPDRIGANGAWADFRHSAGLVGEDGRTVADGANGTGGMKYMLLTGLEACLASAGGQPFAKSYRRLRPGSTGDRVRQYQQELFQRVPNLFQRPIGAPTGVFDPKTTFATLIDNPDAEKGIMTSPVATI